MNDRRAPSGVTPVLATGILVLFSLAGFVGGAVTHGLMHRAGSARVEAATSTPSAHPTVAPHRTPTPITAPTTSASSQAHFALALSFSPAQVRAGESLTITVHATAGGSSTPVANLLCTLSNPGSGTALLTKWPASASTNQQGIATWQVTIPQLAPGQYEMKVSASSADSYSAFWIYWIEVTS